MSEPAREQASAGNELFRETKRVRAPLSLAPTAMQFPSPEIPSESTGAGCCVACVTWNVSRSKICGAERTGEGRNSISTCF